MAFSHFSFCPGLSSDTARMVKFLSRNFLKVVTTCGLSARQGPQQLAQKSINTYLPLNEERLTGFPNVSGWVKSIAGLPIAVSLARSILSRRFFAEGKSR